VRRLLTIGHSYVVAANRRLAHEMARAGAGRWEVTAIAPASYRGDLRPIAIEPIAGELDVLRTLPVRFDRFPHFMHYRGIESVASDDWDVVHCWEEPYVLAGAQIAGHVPRSARFVVATFQNLAKSYPWPLTRFERTSMTRADGWIAFGTTVHDALGNRPAYRDRPVRVISPGVDTDRFRADEELRGKVRTELGWERDACVVGYLGRFVEEKGLRLLMEALAASRSHWRALFVGGGPLEPELRQFAARYTGRVHVQTGVPHDDVPRWVNAMTMLCAPSQTTGRWKEQFGRMLIEAMACGVPVLASDSGEMPHVVGDAGLILPENDARRWAEQIDRLAADIQLRCDLSVRGCHRAESTFAWPVIARAHIDFFEQLLDSPRSR
jgi:phosphatidyl-myo-inositol dimannoside synthase